MTTGADAKATGPFATPRPNMHGRYLIRHPLKAKAVAALDTALALVPKRRHRMPEHPRRILVANWGHLGDVITTFGAIATLRARYPEARIGMIVGSWGKAAIQATGLIDNLHVIDHWGMNRATLAAGVKRTRYRETRAVALAAIRAADYQIGIDFYPFFPVAHPLFFQAGIPIRVGYTSGGFGPLLTHPVDWPDAERPIADHYCTLLDALDPDRPVSSSDLRPHRSRTQLAPLPAELVGRGSYIVLHPGAGAPFKDWGIDHWRDLIIRLQTEHPVTQLVVTGAGAAEVALAEALTSSFPGLISMAGKADWETFVAVIAGAALVVCPDTATGHIAALFDVPTVSIFTGTNSAAQWGPYTENARMLMQPVRCAPCNRPGCEAMACIRGVSPANVMRAIAELHRS